MVARILYGIALVVVVLAVWKLSAPAPVATFPTYVKCGGMDVHLFYQDMSDKWGEFDPLKREIHIEPALPLPFERHVVMHELMHCTVWNATDSDLRPQRLLTEDMWIEAGVQNLVDTLRDNPALVRYMTSQP